MTSPAGTARAIVANTTIADGNRAIAAAYSALLTARQAIDPSLWPNASAQVEAAIAMIEDWPQRRAQ